MPGLKKISFLCLSLIFLSVFVRAQEQLVVIDDAFTREKDGFTIILSPKKSSFKDNIPLVPEYILSAHTYKWDLQSGSLLVMHDVEDKASCTTKKARSRESENIKDQLAGDGDYSLLSETKEKIGDFEVLKLIYRYQTGGKIAHFFYDRCGDMYWLYGLSKISVPDNEDPVIQAMNSFKILK